METTLHTKLLEVCPYFDLSEIIDKNPFWDPTQYEDIFLCYDSMTSKDDQEIKIVSKHRIKSIDIEMDYWGEINRYTKEPYGKGFAIAINY